MKKYTVQTSNNETYKVSLDDIKLGDCYDCGHPEWAWSIDNADCASGVYDNVKAAARLKGVNIKSIIGYATGVVTADGVEHRNDDVTKLVEQLIDDETSYLDERGLPYIYIELDDDCLVVDGEEAWFVDVSETDVRNHLSALAQLAKSLRAQRLDCGLTQVAVAKASGVGVSTLRQIEMGIYNPSYESLTRICNAIDADLTIEPRSAKKG